mgnify:CR=1 FL=1
MYGKKVKLRILFLSSVILISVLTIFLILKSLEENVVYFKSPTEIKSITELDDKKIRVGGVVKEGSILTSSKKINFIITDYKNEINVSFIGAVPNLFAEGKGVIAEGTLQDKKYFVAKRILAKHDENYMPPKK